MKPQNTLKNLNHEGTKNKLCFTLHVSGIKNLSLDKQEVGGNISIEYV